MVFRLRFGCISAPAPFLPAVQIYTILETGRRANFCGGLNVARPAGSQPFDAEQDFASDDRADDYPIIRSDRRKPRIYRRFGPYESADRARIEEICHRRLFRRDRLPEPEADPTMWVIAGAVVGGVLLGLGVGRFMSRR